MITEYTDLPPSVNATNYCRECNAFTYWKEVIKAMSKCVSSRHKTLACAKCGREVVVKT